MVQHRLLGVSIARAVPVALVGLTFVGCSGGSSEGGQDPLVAPIADGAFVAESGLLVVEFESLGATGSWAHETALAGFAGASYLRWSGANFFATPGTDTFACDFYVEQAGTYQLRIHNRHEHPNSTEANDVWARMDGGDWVKTFSWQRGQWTWVTQHEFAHGNYPEAEYTLTSGNHRIEFSGRSTDFCMDRFHLYLATVANPLDTSHPESARHSASGFTAAGALVDPAELPASAHETVLVTLDSGAIGSARPAWRVPGARFADGTHATDPRALVQLAGGVVTPVELTLGDFGAARVRHAVLNVAGAAWRVEGALVAGASVTFEARSFDGATLYAVAPSGAEHGLSVSPRAGRFSATLALDEPGEWVLVGPDRATVALRFAVLP